MRAPNLDGAELAQLGVPRPPVPPASAVRNPRPQRGKTRAEPLMSPSRMLPDAPVEVLAVCNDRAAQRGHERRRPRHRDRPWPGGAAMARARARAREHGGARNATRPTAPGGCRSCAERNSESAVHHAPTKSVTHLHLHTWIDTSYSSLSLAPPKAPSGADALAHNRDY